MEKKKIVGIIILLLFLSIIVILVVMFIVWKNALTLACSPSSGVSLADYPVVCTEFMPAPFMTQFWIFLKNLFNRITWDLIF